MEEQITQPEVKPRRRPGRPVRQQSAGLGVDDIKMIVQAAIEAAQSSGMNAADVVKQTVEALRAPTAEQLEKAKQKLKDREKLLSDQKEYAEGQRRSKEVCAGGVPHTHPDGKTRLQLVRNFPDGYPRAICTWCHLWIEPDGNNPYYRQALSQIQQQVSI